MAVGIKVGSIIDEIGSSDFLRAFFSTVAGNLETQWGSRFPRIMLQLYQGHLPVSECGVALVELQDIRSALSHFEPDKVIWDLEDRNKRPPWGDDIAPQITDLSNYFVTSTGRDLIAVLQEALEAARDENKPADIVSY